MADALKFHESGFNAETGDRRQGNSSDSDSDGYRFPHKDTETVSVFFLLLTFLLHTQLLPGAPPPTNQETKYSFWTFDFYAQYFDIDTSMVVRRMMNSIYPRPGSNFIMQQVRPKPDLYGLLHSLVRSLSAVLR